MNSRITDKIVVDSAQYVQDIKDKLGLSEEMLVMIDARNEGELLNILTKPGYLIDAILMDIQLFLMEASRQQAR